MIVIDGGSASDPAAAAECHRENLLLKKLAPHCIEDTGGLFVAVAGDDEAYIADFPQMCSACGIPARPLTPTEAREMEPALSDRVIAAFAVDDAAIDPFKLSLDNMAAALQNGSHLLRFSQVVGFETHAGRIRSVRLRNTLTGRETIVRADVVVNAAGAWAGQVAALAGIDIRRCPYCHQGRLRVFMTLAPNNPDQPHPKATGPPDRAAA